MITTGIIKEINISDASHENNKYKVELAIFQTPGDPNSSNFTYIATASLPGGMYSSYKVGDKVYVGFVNNELAQPVILGRIYEGLTEENRTYGFLDNLKVADSAELPPNTKIGEIDYTQLKNAITNVDNIQEGEFLIGSNDQHITSSGLKPLKSTDTWASTDGLLPTSKALDNYVAQKIEAYVQTYMETVIVPAIQNYVAQQIGLVALTFTQDDTDNS